MKNKSIILLLVLGLAFTACSRDEDSLFDQSAAERTEKALTNAIDVLTSAENGWEMLYYANPVNAGYTVLLKFEEDNNSTWAIRADYGPILSFDTYNDVMHAWADPQSDGDGYLGDYEFLILEATPQLVRLKGKKHSGYCELHPMPKGKDWQAYFDEVYKLRDMLVTKNDGTAFNFENNGKTEKMVYSDGMMVVNLEEGILYPFTIRPNMVTFYGKGVPSGNDSTFAKNFKINDAKDALVCTDSGISARFVPALTLAEVLNVKLDHHIQWSIDKNDMGSASKTAYNLIANAVKNSGGSLKSMKIQRVDSVKIDDLDTIKYMVDRLNVEFNGSNGVTQAFFIMDFDLNGTSLTYSYKYPSGEPGADIAAKEFLQRAGGGTGKEEVGLKRLKDFITGQFQVSPASGSTLNAQELYITGTNDSNKRLKLTAR